MEETSGSATFGQSILATKGERLSALVIPAESLPPSSFLPSLFSLLSSPFSLLLSSSLSFSFLICHLSFLLSPFIVFLISHLSFLISHFIVFLISHLSFVISHFIVFLICHLSFLICHFSFVISHFIVFLISSSFSFCCSNLCKCEYL